MHPTRIGLNWLVTDLLGEGAMGSVYRCTHAVLTERHAAVKLLQSHNAPPDAPARFGREVATLDRLSHPGIVSCRDAGIDPGTGRFYLAMELVDGLSLDKRLDAGPMSSTEVVAVFDILVNALTYAHENRVFHRDIKPGNIMIGSSGPKLVDFGIARIHGDDPITRPGMLVGTLEYMAPEVLTSDAADSLEAAAAADLYAIGVVMWECLTRQRAFMVRAPTRQAMWSRLLRLKLEGALELPADLPVPRSLASLVTALTAPEQARRLTSPVALRQLFAQARTELRARERLDTTPTASARPDPLDAPPPPGLPPTPEATPHPDPATSPTVIDTPPAAPAGLSVPTTPLGVDPPRPPIISPPAPAVPRPAPHVRKAFLPARPPAETVQPPPHAESDHRWIWGLTLCCGLLLALAMRPLTQPPAPPMSPKPTMATPTRTTAPAATPIIEPPVETPVPTTPSPETPAPEVTAPPRLAASATPTARVVRNRSTPAPEPTPPPATPHPTQPPTPAAVSSAKPVLFALMNLNEAELSVDGGAWVRLPATVSITAGRHDLALRARGVVHHQDRTITFSDGPLTRILLRWPGADAP